MNNWNPTEVEDVVHALSETSNYIFLRNRCNVCISSRKKWYFANKLSKLACSNEANILVQHHPTLLVATCWPRLNTMLDGCWIMLEDIGFSLNFPKISVQHRATLLVQQCCTMLASFEQVLMMWKFSQLKNAYFNFLNMHVLNSYN